MIFAAIITIEALTPLKAQFIRYPADIFPFYTARLSPHFTDVFSATANASSLPQITGFTAGAYAEKRYMLNDLDLAALAFAFATDHAGYGLSVEYFGNSGYNEINIGLSYGRSMGNINVGASFSYHILNISGYKNQALPGVAFSTLWKLTDKVYSSLQIINPPFFSKKHHEHIHSAYSFSLGYEASPDVYTGIEINKQEDRSLRVTGILQYWFNKKYYARIGMVTSVSEYFAGIGWQRKEFRLDISVRYHPSLGVTPGVSGSVSKKNNSVQE
jgi:hypothetical protein